MKKGKERCELMLATELSHYIPIKTGFHGLFYPKISFISISICLSHPLQKCIYYYHEVNVVENNDNKNNITPLKTSDISVIKKGILFRCACFFKEM